MRIEKANIIPIIAMILLLIGTFSTISVYSSQVDKETITISGEEYTIEQIFTLAELKTIQTDEGEISGASLEELIAKTGISCSSCEFTITAKDGYQKTVKWDIFKTGVITNNARIYFPNTPHAMWVRDVIEIEAR